MAPPPEYDKEPKAPDKSATITPVDDWKTLHNLAHDHQNNSDSKTANTTANVEVENNKHVEHLDDGQLKALLDEAITYKCPKDREGKSSLFNELLEEVEQDEQALEAAARELSGTRASRRAPRGGRRALAHSNSLQDLEQEALAAECALRRVRHASHAPASVSARAIHGGSLPCDVDKSFLLGDESSGRGGYLATVRCVNPPPLNERRVSASDAHDSEPGAARRTKPAIPMTYTARATLEIGSGSVGSGRAVTTTTASNQVRTHPRRRPPRPLRISTPWTPLTTGPPARLYTERLYNPYPESDYTYKKLEVSHSDVEKQEKNNKQQRKCQQLKNSTKNMTLPTVEEIDSNQKKLLDALRPKSDLVVSNEESRYEDVFSIKLLPNAHPIGGKEDSKEDVSSNNSVAHRGRNRITDVEDVSSKKLMPKTNHCSGKQKSNVEDNSLNKLQQKVHPGSGNQNSNAKYISSNKLMPETARGGSNQKFYSESNKFLPKADHGGGNQASNVEDVSSDKNVELKIPLDPIKKKKNKIKCNVRNQFPRKETNENNEIDSSFWMDKVDSWYEGLETYSSEPPEKYDTSSGKKRNCPFFFSKHWDASCEKANGSTLKSPELPLTADINLSLPYKVMSHMQRRPKNDEDTGLKDVTQRKQHQNYSELVEQRKDDPMNNASQKKHNQDYAEFVEQHLFNIHAVDDEDEGHSTLIQSRLEYRARVGSLVVPKVTCVNPKNVRRMTIGKNPVTEVNQRKNEAVMGKKCRMGATVEKNYESYKPVNDFSNKDINDTGLNIQLFKSVDEELLTHNIEVNWKKSANPEAEKISKRSVSINSLSEEIIQDKVLILTVGAKEHLSDHCEEFSNENTTQYTTVEKNHNIDMSENNESCSCSNTDDDNAVNTKYKHSTGSKLPITEDTIVYQEDNFNGLFVSENYENISCADTKFDAVDIELKDVTESKLLINEEKIELEIHSVRETQDTKVQHHGDEFDMSYFATETESGKKEDKVEIQLTDVAYSSKLYVVEEEGVELLDIKSDHQNTKATFSKYLDEQQNLFKALEDNINDLECITSPSSKRSFKTIDNNKIAKGITNILKDEHKLQHVKAENNLLDKNDLKLQLFEKEFNEISSAKYVLGVNPNNAYFFLTFPKSLSIPFNKLNLHEVETNTTPAKKNTAKSRKKRKKAGSGTTNSNKRILSREEFRALLFQNLTKSEADDHSVRQKETSVAPGRQVDSAIPFNCITSSEVVDTCNTATSTQSSVAEDTKPLQLGWGYRAVASLTGVPTATPRSLSPPAARASPAADCTQPRSVISSSFNGLPLARTNYGSTATTTSSDEYKKSLDENGNSLQGFSSPQSGSSHNKKPRRKKSSKNETVITSHQIDGYKGDKDLNEVLRFIESHAEQGRAHKLGRAKHGDADDKAGKKRSAERRKDKETKMKRATSMEELSRTTLESLTDAPAETRRAPAPAKAERRSWGDGTRDSFYFRDDAVAAADAPPDADFQTVTKKRKPRRRADEPEPEPPRPPRAPTPRARRVSAPPPSDRSGDSNDDMDSVHSLPAPPFPPAPAPAPVSYADIARTRHNIPDLIESCNYYAEGEPAAEARARGDADGYPALDARPHSRRPRDVHAKPTAPRARSRDRKEARAVTLAPAPAACPAPDVVADRRPPVILLDSAARPGDMDGVTFGFDINEQLLGGSTRRPRCDLVRDAVESNTTDDVTAVDSEYIKPAPDKPAAVDAGAIETATEGEIKPVVEGAKKSLVEQAVKPAVDGTKKADVEGVKNPVMDGAMKPVVEAVVAAAGGVAVAAGCHALRWLPPHAPHDTHQLLQIVDYVGAAWEDVVRCSSVKVRYFTE